MQTPITDEEYESFQLVQTHQRKPPSCEIKELEAYKSVTEMNEIVIQQDWEAYGTTFSRREVLLSLQELGMIGPNATVDQLPPHLEEEYRCRIVQQEMKQDRGHYNKLIDYSVLEEHVQSPNKEVCYLFKYTYLLANGEKYVENEHIWCVNEGRSNWKIEFHGVPPVNYSQSVFNIFKNICCITPGGN